MSNRLFMPELVDVEESDGGDDRWTVGYDLQADSSAVSLDVSEYCNPGSNSSHVSGPTVASKTNPAVYNVIPFAAVVSAYRNIRCTSDQIAELVPALLNGGGTVSACEYALWNSIPTWDNSVNPTLSNVDVSTISASANPAIPDTIAALLIRRAQLTVMQANLLHLGLKSAIDLSAMGQVYADGSGPDGQLRFRATDSPIVVSPYYPATGIAVTGPIRIQLGKMDGWQEYDITQNRTMIRAYRMCSIGFDPGSAVRAV